MQICEQITLSTSSRSITLKKQCRRANGEHECFDCQKLLDSYTDIILHERLEPTHKIIWYCYEHKAYEAC